MSEPPLEITAHRQLVFGLGGQIVDVDDRPADHRPAADRSGGQRQLEALDTAGSGGQHRSERAHRGRAPEHATLQPEDRHIGGPAEAGRRPYHRVQHRPQIGGGGRDRPEDLGGGGLLLEGLGQLPVARLQGLEQTGVLDGDDGQLGKGLQQRDLPLRKPARLGPRNHDGADGGAVLEHGHRQRATEPCRPHALGQPVLAIPGDIGDLDHLAAEHRAGRRGATSGCHRIDAPECGVELGTDGGVGRDLDHPAVESHDAAVQRAAEPHRPVGDQVEHRPGVTARSTDGLEDLAGRFLLRQRLGQERVDDGGGGRRRSTRPRVERSCLGLVALRLPRHLASWAARWPGARAADCPVG